MNEALAGAWAWGDADTAISGGRADVRRMVSARGAVRRQPERGRAGRGPLLEAAGLQLQRRQQQAADTRRQRSTCRRATSGTLGLIGCAAAVNMSNTLTLWL
ncbi:hypothetical protein GCM10017750_37310 [Streptomyces racemochromogenes]